VAAQITLDGTEIGLSGSRSHSRKNEAPCVNGAANPRRKEIFGDSVFHKERTCLRLDSLSGEGMAFDSP
jgi:hypothetical protein